MLNRVLAVEDVESGRLVRRPGGRRPPGRPRPWGTMEAVSVLAAGSFGSAAIGEAASPGRTRPRCFPPPAPCWREKAGLLVLLKS